MLRSDHAASLAPVRVRVPVPLAYALGTLLLQALAKVGAFVRARRNRRTITELAEYDDRTLKDIGLSRSAVEGALAVGFGEDPSALLTRASPSHAVRAVERAEQLPRLRLHG
jgi:uncharacterized protein YjiS (DUF1127 family)